MNNVARDLVLCLMQALIAKESRPKAKRELLKQSDMKWIPEDMDEKQFIKVLFSSPKWNPKNLRYDQKWDESSRTVKQVLTIDFFGLFYRDTF